MTIQLIDKLKNFATAAEGMLTTKAKELAPKLHAAADDLEHKLEAWTSSVDHWVETHFTPEAEKLREQAGADYRAAVAEAHKLVDEAKTHL
ncbi:MAG TPA: hypothetical protein VKQ30_16180 [Ktedonobacterales bacterium]|nr:hypothetical protein [Ktedonobacterales bacterium]